MKPALEVEQEQQKLVEDELQALLERYYQQLMAKTITERLRSYR